MLWLPSFVQGAGLVLIVIALARPASRERIAQATSGIDIVLCVDLSSSMTANDLDPKLNRLEVAKAAASTFISGRTADRLGLVGFARYPDLLCPLTRDRQALTSLLGDAKLVAADGPEDATGIGTAVGRAAALLARNGAKSKVVILLTDGEENVATSETPDEIGPRKAATLCKELGVRVYTIIAGTGSRGQGGEWRKLDPTEMQALAEVTGGHCFAAASAESVAGVYARIHELEKAQTPDPRDRFEDRFEWFVLLGLALCALARLLRTTVLAVAP